MWLYNYWSCCTIMEAFAEIRIVLRKRKSTISKKSHTCLPTDGLRVWSFLIVHVVMHDRFQQVNRFSWLIPQNNTIHIDEVWMFVCHLQRARVHSFSKLLCVCARSVWILNFSVIFKCVKHMLFTFLSDCIAFCDK